MIQMWTASQTDIFAIQADADPDVSAIDQRVGSRIAARSDVEAVSGLIWTAVSAASLDFASNSFWIEPIRRFRLAIGSKKKLSPMDIYSQK